MRAGSEVRQSLRYLTITVRNPGIIKGDGKIALGCMTIMARDHRDIDGKDKTQPWIYDQKDKEPVSFFH